MPWDNLKTQVLNGLFSIAGNVVHNQITKPNYEEEGKHVEDYYSKMKALAREDEKKRKVELARNSRKPVEQPVEPTSNLTQEKDLTQEKISEGQACLACTDDHFSTVSGALSEALRFARKGGIRHPEVMRRVGLARDELNICERMDLSPEQIVQLKGKEKELAEWGLNESRDLRHKLMAMQTPDDLEKVAADVAKIRTKFMRDLWSIATVDGTIEKLCKGLKEEERERCIATINTVLKEKKDLPAKKDLPL